ncbi:Porin subfamily protein [compost metagenome]
MDIDVFPNVVDFMGPNGMAFTRRPQIRYTPMSGASSFAIALENPGADLDEALGDVSPDNKYPDLTAQFRTSGDWGHAQVAGLLRYLGFDTPGAAGANPKDNQTGWGINLTSNFKFKKSDRLILAVVYGNGIASYMNDGGTDLAPDGPPGNLDAQAVPLVGIVAYYDHTWDDLWTSSIGYSRTEVTNTDFQAADAFNYGEYASANVLYAPQKNILTGAEFLYGTRHDKNGDNGEDYRLQVTMKYSFSSKD